MCVCVCVYTQVSNIQSCQTSYGEQSLQRKLYPAIENFLKKLNIPEKVCSLSSPSSPFTIHHSPFTLSRYTQDISDHQLYIEEVIELNENTAFLLLLPPPDLVCTPPGSTDQFVGSNFTHLPISNFELCKPHSYTCICVVHIPMLVSNGNHPFHSTTVYLPAQLYH